MLPKGVLGRQYYRRLYVYSKNEIAYKNKSIPLNYDLYQI